MQDYMPYMQAMGLPSQYCNMMETSQNQLELMYPKIYYIILYTLMLNAIVICSIVNMV
jgi:predicted double-glycine peptidase